jgi:dTDP-glucose 4,6-dehydratase
MERARPSGSERSPAPGVTAAASFEGRTAVVTGAAGFLGSHVCRRLLDAGVEVVGIDSLITGRRDNLADLAGRSGFTLRQADVVDRIDVDDAVALVLHLASPASPVDYLRHPIHTLKVGSIGTLHALGAAKATGARTAKAAPANNAIRNSGVNRSRVSDSACSDMPRP